jgi:hypothetical protein
MAAAVRSTKFQPVGQKRGPQDIPLVDATNIDVDSNIDFVVWAGCQGIEILLVSGTGKTGTPSVVFTLQRVDPVTNTAYDLVASTAMTDTGSPLYLATSLYSPAVTNKVAQRIVSEHMRLKIDYTGTPVTDVLNNFTATITAN